MFPPLQIPGQGLSSPGELRVPPGPSEIHPVNWRTSSISNPPPEHHSGAPRRPLISLPMKLFQPPAELWNADVTGMTDLPPLPEMSYDNLAACDESDGWSDLGGAEGKQPIGLKQTKCSLKQFAQTMEQDNNSAFNKWKKVWVAGLLKKKHRSILWGQNRLKRVCVGPLHWEMAVADFLETLEKWVPLENFDNAEWIRWQCVQIFL